MKILYIAVSCDPYNGSEDQIGWSIPWECAKEDQVYVITRTDLRESIEKYISIHEKRNLNILYVEMPKLSTVVFRGPFHSGRLYFWNKKAYKVAKKVCEQCHIEIVHQITPIEFRNVGDYGKIPDIKFVCGPLGGAESIPKGLESYAKNKCLIEFIRLFMNRISIMRLRASGLLKTCDYVLFANQETRDYIKRFVPVKNEGFLYSEIGIDALHEKEYCKEKRKTTFLVAGRLIYRKGVRFLLDAVKNCNTETQFRVIIASDGTEYNLIKKMIKETKLENGITLLGNVPYVKMEEVYSNSDILILPSLRETTGSVILEAMSRGIPVITLKHFGGNLIVKDGYNGWIYDGDTKEEYISNLARTMKKCVAVCEDDDEINRFRFNALKTAKEFTWQQKVLLYRGIYDKLLKEKRPLE